jgi:hypothetical protein
MKGWLSLVKFQKIIIHNIHSKDIDGIARSASDCYGYDVDNREG